MVPPLEEGTCLVARLDYGYDGAKAHRLERLNAALAPPQEKVASEDGGLLVRRADFLLGWAKLRGWDNLWEKLAARALGPGLVLECRFPRRARGLLEAMARNGVPTRFWETPADGRTPPLYERLSATSPLRRIHLRLEWESGLSAARGGIGLVRVARLLALHGSMEPGELAARLRISAGALRSYVTWMEDAALVRRAGAGVLLRHPLLDALFLPEEPSRPRHRPPRPSPSTQWDPVELD